MLLFPGVWHRYRPSPAVGWSESWIELGGRQIDELHRSRVITSRKPIHVVGGIPEILHHLIAGRQLAQRKPPGFQVRLGLLGLQILTYMAWRPSLPAPHPCGLSRWCGRRSICWGLHPAARCPPKRSRGACMSATPISGAHSRRRRASRPRNTGWNFVSGARAISSATRTRRSRRSLSCWTTILHFISRSTSRSGLPSRRVNGGEMGEIIPAWRRSADARLD